MSSFTYADLLEDISAKKVCRQVNESFVESVWKLKVTKQLADATIRLDDGKEFLVHRVILAACSDYFRTIFTTTLSENISTNIHLPGINSEILELILDYIYLKKIIITPSNVGSLLITADYLCVSGIKQLCCEHLKLHLSPVNCLSIRLFAREYFCEDLHIEAHNYTMRNFVQIVTSSSELVMCTVEEMEDILDSDELNVRSEEIVWETVLKWINYDEEGRKKYLAKLMYKIRLGLFETKYFLENVKDHHLITNNEDCRPIVIDTLKFLYDLEMMTQKNGEFTAPDIARPRFPHEILFAIGGWSGGSATNAIETYDIRADRWILVEDVGITGPRAYHATAVLGFDIYVIGGFDGIQYFNSCMCFDAVHKTWREVAPMNSRRCYVSVAVLDGMVYAMGGYDGHHRQNTVERYNPKTNQWSFITPMHCLRSDASATVLNGKIYITGGFNGTECMSSAEMFDPETNRWTMITPMRSRRSGVSCITYNNCIYVIGGFNGISRMCSGEKFNPNNNQWTSIPDMYNPRSNFAIEVLDDMVFVIGGFNGITTIFNAECYDDKTNEWYQASNMNVCRSAVSACVIAGLPNKEDYILKHRESFLEEKRQNMFVLSNQLLDGNDNPVNNQDQQNPNAINRNNNAISINNALISIVGNVSASRLLAIEDAPPDREENEE